MTDGGLEAEIRNLKRAIWCVLKPIGTFRILDPGLVPQGLKPIARSISWLVEQVVVQNLRAKGESCGIERVEDPAHGLGAYDCTVYLSGNTRPFRVNVKTSLTSTSHNSRFDVNKADKLIELYVSEPQLVLLLAIVKVDFLDTRVTFRDLIVSNVAWTPDIYYNRANHNLQSRCDGSQVIRSNEEFVRLLREQLKAAGHGEHY